MTERQNTQHLTTERQSYPSAKATQRRKLLNVKKTERRNCPSSILGTQRRKTERRNCPTSTVTQRRKTEPRI
jgi:hypothetical protein